MFLVSDWRDQNIYASTREDFCLVFISGLLYQGLDIRYLDGMSIKSEDGTLAGRDLKTKLIEYLPHNLHRI